MAVTVYHYPGCSTCRKARKWLEASDVEFRLVDIVEHPPSQAALKRMVAAGAKQEPAIPLAKFFNTSGQSYRGGGFKDRLPGMSDAQKLAALAADGKLIKRPLVDADGVTLVGFCEADWAAALT